MQRRITIRYFFAILAFFLALHVFPLCPSAHAADTLAWEVKRNQVSADIKSASLRQLLERIASVTGWRVYVEPGTEHQVSAKFKNLPPGDALRMLLGDLNFALVPETKGASKLLVFHTTAQNATQLVSPARTLPGKAIPNELIVRLEPGVKIDELARRLGAKVIGKIDGLNAYRLQFDDAKATAAAREQLAGNPDVAAVDNNYSIGVPAPPDLMSAAPVPPPHLELKPPPDNGRIIVGLIDTAVQPLGNGLDAFLLKQISVEGQAQLDPNTPSHGTSMAETMLRSVQTITKGSSSIQILPVDVYGANPSSSTFDIANGITQAVNGGARIINLSLGGEGESSFLHGVIQDAKSQGITFFGAAGNEATTTPFYPAAYPEVNSVTAIDHGQVAPYANQGNWVSLGAPGTSVVYYNNQPWSVVGTSASAAYLSGAMAGYMDSTGASADRAQTFIRNNFGLTATPPSPTSSGK